MSSVTASIADVVLFLARAGADVRGSGTRELTVYPSRTRAPSKTSREACGRTSWSSTKSTNVLPDGQRRGQLIGHGSEAVPASQIRAYACSETLLTMPGHVLACPSTRTTHPHLIPHEHTQKHERRRRGAPLAVCVLGSSHEQSARMLRPAREPSPGRWSPPQRDQTPPLMLTAERLPAVSPSDP